MREFAVIYKDTRPAALLLFCLLGSVTMAQSGGQYILTGTIGQADAASSAGGGYEVLGGFWPGGPLCTVEFHHYARFADYWLYSGCDAGNDWCGGADLDQLGDVDGVDLGLFVQEWLSYCPYDWPLR